MEATWLNQLAGSKKNWVALDNSFDNLLWDIRKLNIKEAESALYANA
jgi:hypothetical protein